MTEPNDFSHLSPEDAERLLSTYADAEVEPGDPTDDVGDDPDAPDIEDDDEPPVQVVQKPGPKPPGP